MDKAQVHRAVLAVELSGLFFGELAEHWVLRQWALGVETFDRFF